MMSREKTRRIPKKTKWALSPLQKRASLLLNLSRPTKILAAVDGCFHSFGQRNQLQLPHLHYLYSYLSHKTSCKSSKNPFLQVNTGSKPLDIGGFLPTTRNHLRQPQDFRKFLLHHEKTTVDLRQIMLMSS